MKNKKHSFFGTLIMGMAFAPVLAGCPTTGGSETPPTPGEQAEQLAAELNAITVGIATAAGASVKLTGDVWLNRDLTVPAGVTLDVTGAALGLGSYASSVNNVTLTVNGTIIAGHSAEGWNDIRLEDNAVAATINGNGTIRLQSKGSLFTVEGGGTSNPNRKLTLDGVTLVGIADNDNSLVNVSGGGEFVLKSGVVTGNAIYATEGWVDSGGVRVNGGTFTMEGGTISGNSAYSDGPEDNGGSGGGGVSLWENGLFTMKGGAISNNSAGTNGGGILVGDGATFTMEGGAISGNTNSDSGGGVAIAGTFTMKGGEISGNTAAMDGGGARVFNNGIFVMEGGAIWGNTASWGGGVHVKESAFTLKGGRIQGGTDSDGFAKNDVYEDGDGWWSMALGVYKSTAKWGTGGAYTQGSTSYDEGGPKAGGSDIVDLDDNGSGGVSGTLIAIPAA
jgi:hypothetical protein